MMKLISIRLIFMFFCITVKCHNVENDARQFIEILNIKLAKRDYRIATVNWNYKTNITQENYEKYFSVTDEVAAESKNDWLELKQFKWGNVSDPDLRRQIKLFSILGVEALPADKYNKFMQIIGELSGAYRRSTVCSFKNSSDCSLHIEPEIAQIMAESRDPNELKYLWVEMRNVLGINQKKGYIQYVKYINEVAQLNGCENASDLWLGKYERDDFKALISTLWSNIKPLYVHLHAYVRYNLRKRYGCIVSETGPIPAHLLGNVWAQSWENLADFMMPFPEIATFNITNELLRRNYSPIKIVETAESFYTSLNFKPESKLFWKNSLLVKPDGREVSYHAGCYDFCDGSDFRIKQNTEINQECLFQSQIHLGYIKYFQQYKDLPRIYRAAPIDAFYEAIGGTVNLSARTMKHLHKINLSPLSSSKYEDILNELFVNALANIAFLPYAYIVDMWRWDVFEGKINPNNYNCKWWDLRISYQGVQPPVNRSEANFDPISKYHVAVNIPYIHHFVSYILIFQFHKALCKEAGQYDPKVAGMSLNECDIYGSKAAGNKLKQMMKLGASKSWMEALKVLTGEEDLDAGPLLEYYDPLLKWLVIHNQAKGINAGWGPANYFCLKQTSVVRKSAIKLRVRQ